MSTFNESSLQAPLPVKPNSTLAVTSLISGIVGWTFVPILGSIVAVITGHMAKNEIRKSNGELAGDGMATAGLVLGYASLVIGICVCLVVILFPAVLGGFWIGADQIFIP